MQVYAHADPCDMRKSFNTLAALKKVAFEHVPPQLVEEVHVADVADKVCSSCGGQLTEWSGQYE